jgi:signal transduction histidine kinase
MRAYELKVNNINLQKNLDPDCPSLLADEHQLQQVFINIIINAEQAILHTRKSGKIEVTTRHQEEEKAVQVIFDDDGPGIPEEILSKIFDPFFTTKPDGKGTGLGLSISYSIIQEHGGRLWAANNAQGGATFTVELPVSSGDEAIWGSGIR